MRLRFMHKIKKINKSSSNPEPEAEQEAAAIAGVEEATAKEEIKAQLEHAVRALVVGSTNKSVKDSVLRGAVDAVLSRQGYLFNFERYFEGGNLN